MTMSDSYCESRSLRYLAAYYLFYASTILASECAAMYSQACWLLVV